ncbi:MAG: ribonuclease P protein component [Pseudomonadales bacterium]|nr:ribonuclease P protein component [Pseudomonadales bacterium]
MADHGFPPSQRLRRPGEFDAVFKKAQLRVSHQACLALAIPNRLDRRRLGLVVGKKAAPRAVDRNRLKRLMRESFRQHCLLEGMDVVLVARPAARDYANPQFSDVMCQVWQELHEKRQQSIQ